MCFLFNIIRVIRPRLYLRLARRTRSQRLLGDILPRLLAFRLVSSVDPDPGSHASPPMAGETLPQGEVIGIVIGAVVLFCLISIVPM